MGLASQAKAVATTERIKQQQDVKRQQEANRAKQMVELANVFAKAGTEVEVRELDRVHHFVLMAKPKDHPGERSTYRLEKMAGLRVKVDDVTLVYCRNSYYLHGEGWAVEVTCSRCGADTLPHQQGGAIQHLATWNPIPSIGGTLNGRWLCGRCQSGDVEASCPTCHRPYIESA
jgi:hypothetical protein